MADGKASMAGRLECVFPVEDDGVSGVDFSGEDAYPHRPAGKCDVAIVRLEELVPFPHHAVQQMLAKYPAAAPVWCQEEPMNAGAWPGVGLRAAAPRDGLQGGGRGGTGEERVLRWAQAGGGGGHRAGRAAREGASSARGRGARCQREWHVTHDAAARCGCSKWGESWRV